jgi:RNA polymerase sigma-70 factor, ECF subfamily
MTEREAIDRVLKGEADAFRFLVERYERPVFCMIHNMIHRHHDCEDLVQDVFVSAFKSLHSHDASRSSFLTWLFTIARNKCLNAMARKSPTLMHQLPEKAERKTPQDHLVNQELFEQLDQALATLPLEQKTAFVLAELVELTCEDIATIEGTPAGTIRSRVSRARTALRSSLQQFSKGET